MDRISKATTDFISQLRARPSRRAVDAILQAAVQEEESLRRMFAQDRQNPLLQNLIIGLINPFTVPPEVRRIRARSRDALHVAYLSPHDERTFDFPVDHLFPLKSDLVKKDGVPCTVRSIKEFRSNWDIYTQGALKRFREWDNVVVAGGAVSACLFPPPGQDSDVRVNDRYQSDAYRGSDIDIFMWGLDAEEAKAKILDIYHSIRSAISWRITCVRKVNTITLYTEYPMRPIQIVLRLYSSPAEILAGFDVDSACCLYNGRNVYMNPRALAAFIRQANTIDLSRRSPSYEVRLAKYANRGFEIYFPSLNRLRLDYDTLYSPYRMSYPSGLSLLIVLELLYTYPGAYQSLYKAKWQGTGTAPLNFVPIERKLLQNNYDSSWLRIPYGPTWNAKRIQKFIFRINKKMNSKHNPTMANGSRKLHRHLAVSGSMSHILASPCCRNCPAPTTQAERDLIISEASKYIRGYVSFIERNPGRQLVGSFNPVDQADWSGAAYVVPGSPLANIYISQPVSIGAQEVFVEEDDDHESPSDDNDYRSASQWTDSTEDIQDESDEGQVE